jgi:tRNA-dihydrouridine synthase 3
VQLAGKDPDEMAWAAALVEARGADFVDVNLGCPIDQFTRKGLGAALGRQPGRVQRIVQRMSGAVRIPVTVKIRLGWDDRHLNYLDLARAAVDGGAAAIFVHGRTRDARYRYAADWDRIGEVASSVTVPVVGNGDLLFPSEVDAARARAGCAGVMVARGALIKPWLFREVARGAAEDLPAEDRLALYRRYVDLAKAHWGTDEYGLTRVRDFTRWHLGFWCRYRPARPDGSVPTMQERDSGFVARSPLEAFLARADSLAHDYLVERLLRDEAVDPQAVAGQEAAAEDALAAEHEG